MFSHLRCVPEKIMMVQGENAGIRLCIRDIINNAKRFRDKLKAYEILIYFLFITGEKLSAVDAARTVLAQLGFPLPHGADIPTVTREMVNIRDYTLNLSLEGIKSLPLMTDDLSLQTMKIMEVSLLPFYQVEQHVFPLLVTQMVRLTIKSGYCDESAVAFGAFGFIELTLFRNFNEAYKMGMLAKKILDRSKATKQVTRLYTNLYGIIAMWKEPIQATAEQLLYAAKVGFFEGDRENAVWSLKMSYRQSFVAGRNLQTLRKEQESFCQKMVSLQRAARRSPLFVL